MEKECLHDPRHERRLDFFQHVVDKPAIVILPLQLVHMLLECGRLIGYQALLATELLTPVL